MTKKTTKRAFMLSLLSLLMCCTMLLGTTFAWFTDTVTSTGNRIVAGTLDVQLWMDKAEDGTYTNISNGTGDIFDSRANGNGANWEPGKTEIVYLAVANVGSLDLKYQIHLDIQGELAGALEYAILDGAKAADLAAVTSWSELTAFAGVQAGDVTVGKLMAAPNGALLSETEDYFAFAVHMKEDAGNEFQDKDIVIDVKILATQLNSESDSFNNQYDEGASWLGSADTEWYVNDTAAASYTLDTPAELAGLAALVNEGNTFAGKTIALAEDMDMNNIPWVAVGTETAPFEGTFDGNGYTVYNFVTDTAMFGYAINGATIQNVNFENVDLDGKFVATVVNYAENITIENVQVLSGNIDATSYGAAIAFEAYDITIKNCINKVDVDAGYSASGIGAWIYNATIENCTNDGDLVAANRAGGICGNFSGTMTACTNNGDVTNTGTGAAAGIIGILGGASSIANCTNNGDVITTADNANASAAGILGQLPSKTVTITNCTNKGMITAEKSTAAGIAVSLYGGVTANACVNEGNVNGGDGAEGVVAAKGIFGGKNTVTDCTNTGIVTVG